MSGSLITSTVQRRQAALCLSLRQLDNKIAIDNLPSNRCKRFTVVGHGESARDNNPCRMTSLAKPPAW